MIPEDTGEQRSWHALFVPNAENRAQRDMTMFMRTHVPMLLEQENGALCNEREVLRRLLAAPDDPQSNRIWFLTGAEGTGKSELLEWLSITLAQHEPQRAPFLVQIRAHEASLLHVGSMLRRLLALEDGDDAVVRSQRWREASQKPSLVAKGLLIWALDQLIPSDEVGIPLLYRLSNLMEDKLEDFLRAGEQQRGTARAFEWITAREWEEFLQNTSLPIPFSYGAFQQAVQMALAHYVLGLQDLPALLQALQQRGQMQGVRPVLLIDDVFSSLHIMAPDLLSTLLSMPGGWDVVCNITPDSDRPTTLEFVNRLATAPGSMGWYRLPLLEEQPCLALARTYLSAFWQMQEEAHEACYPFNDALLVRLLRGLPEHVRSSRAYLRHLHLILQDVERVQVCSQSLRREEALDTLLSRLAQLATREYVVLSENRRLALLGELLGPLVSDSTPSIRFIPSAFFQDEQIPVHLPIQLERREGTVSLRGVVDWLRHYQLPQTEDYTVVRKGAARLLRDTLAPEYLGVPEGRPSFLHWHQPHKGVTPPVLMPHDWFNAKKEGIFLSSLSARLIVDLADYATAAGEARRMLAIYLRNEAQLAPFFEEARHYQQQVRDRVEQELRMPLESLALTLALWSVVVPGDESAIPEFTELANQLGLFPQQSLRSAAGAESMAREWQEFFAQVWPFASEVQQSWCIEGITRSALLDFWGRDYALPSLFRWRGRPFSQALNEWRAQLQPFLMRLGVE